jgi:DsbC/DsbD-like thiol-disulfide interchange protein
MLMIGLALACDSHAIAGSNKSDSKVKATAVASKIGAGGKQTVTITLAIEKDWHLYANPVNHKEEFLEAAQTKVTFASAKPVKVESIKYPSGMTVVDKADQYDVYKGTVKIQASVKRAAGDTGPLEVRIAVNACNKNVCLQPATIKLTAK